MTDNNGQGSSPSNVTTSAAGGSTSVLPSYSAATTDPNTTNGPMRIDNAYTDFTISDLRAQILANAAMLRPFFTDRKYRSEYEMELILAKCSSGQHTAMLVRNNHAQTIKDDLHHGVIIINGKAHDTPRQAFEALLAKTEDLLGDMLRTSKIRFSLAGYMHGSNPRQYG